MKLVEFEYTKFCHKLRTARPRVSHKSQNSRNASFTEASERRTGRDDAAHGAGRAGVVRIVRNRVARGSTSPPSPQNTAPDKSVDDSPELSVTVTTSRYVKPAFI